MEGLVVLGELGMNQALVGVELTLVEALQVGLAQQQDSKVDSEDL